MEAESLGRVTEGQRWLKLQSDLERWVRRRVRPPIDPADVAADVAFQAAKLGVLLREPWPRLWQWSAKAAVSAIADQLRRARRYPLLSLGKLDFAIPKMNQQSRLEDLELVGQLLSRASGLRREVLLALAVGSARNVDLAERFCCTVRAVEMARQWLRHEVSRLQKTEGTLRSRTLLE